MHWFFDKLGMTGSRAQLYNGLILLATFFGCRIVWGIMQTYFVFCDVWRALDFQEMPYPDLLSKLSSYDLIGNASNPALAQSHYGDPESVRYAGPHVVPFWLALTYLVSNTLLSCLNLYWFNKMIEAVRKRFRPGAQQQGKKEKRGEGMDNEIKSGVEEDGHVIQSSGGDEKVEVKITEGGKAIEILSSHSIHNVDHSSSGSSANSSRQRRRHG